MTSRPRQKILFLIHTLGGGGAEKVLVDTVSSLDRSKFDITVMTVINTGVNIKRLPKDIAYKSMITLPSWINPRSKSGSLSANASNKVKILGAVYNFMWCITPASWVYRLFIREKYDVEAAFLEGISAKIISKSSNRSSKKLCWIHVDFLNEHKSKKVFATRQQEKNCYNSFDSLICVSESTRNGFHHVVGARGKTMVLNNIVDTSDAIKRAGIAESRANEVFTIRTVGRLADQKGYDRLLRVARRLNRDGLVYQLEIIGDGPDKDMLEAYIDQNELKNVHLLGYRTNPYRYMKTADLFVISSRAEGFSTVMTEAIALGTPILTTKVSGTDILPESMVVDNNTDALYEGMKSLLEDPSRYRRLQQDTKTIRKKIIANIEESMQKIQKVLS